MTLYAYLVALYHVLGCRTYEDLSALCGGIGWGGPVVDPLATVTDTARRRERAIAEYIAAILTAREHGATWQAIGAAAGVTRQSVHEMIRRHETRDNYGKPGI